MHTHTRLFWRNHLVRLLFTLTLASAGQQSLAQSAEVSNFQIDGRFVIEDVRLQGLQRVSAGTVFNLISVSVGDPLDTVAVRIISIRLFQRHSAGSRRWGVDRNVG